MNAAHRQRCRDKNRQPKGTGQEADSTVKHILILLSAAAAGAAGAAEPPVIPAGLDAYRMWERWPYQRIGVRAYMRSTYDRKGGNERCRRKMIMSYLRKVEMSY